HAAIDVHHPLHHPHGVRRRDALELDAPERGAMHADDPRQEPVAHARLLGPSFEGTRHVEDERHRIPSRELDDGAHGRGNRVAGEPSAEAPWIGMIHALDPVAHADRDLAHQTAGYGVEVEMRIEEPDERAVAERWASA